MNSKHSPDVYDMLSFIKRKHLANALGFENYAQMSMETKMARNIDNVLNMIER